MLVSVMCQDAGFIIGTIIKVVRIVQWAIPMLLIVLITFDLFKAMTGQLDDKAKKDALNKSVKRILYAVIVFLVPTLVNIVLLKIAPISVDETGNLENTSTSYLECWNYYYNK